MSSFWGPPKTPILNKFKPVPPQPVTAEQVEAIFKKYEDVKPQNPTVKKAKTEIEKELAAAFEEKERRILDLYRQGNEEYAHNHYKKSISFYNAALEITQTDQRQL